MWDVMTQDRKGDVSPSGESYMTYYQARGAAQELAWQHRNTTYFIQSRKNGRIPCVFHFVKV